VLLQSVLCKPAPVVHPSLLETSEGVAEGGGDEDYDLHHQQHQHHQQQQETEAEAGGPDSAEAGGSSSNQHQQQQLLLVATKVTGDRNVPAGQVTFAVDLGSRSTAGAGQLLALSAGIHSDVKLNASGTRPFIVKVSGVVASEAHVEVSKKQWGQLLELSADIHSDVRLNALGTRPSIIKVSGVVACGAYVEVSWAVAAAAGFVS
jgi:hypothetical protein